VDRPYRVSRILDVPSDLSITSEEKLRELHAALNTLPGASTSANTAAPEFETFDFTKKAVYPRNADSLIDVGDRHNATLQEVGRMHYEKEHPDFDSRYAAIIEWREKNVVSPRSVEQDKKVWKMVESSLKWKPSPKLTLTAATAPGAATSTTSGQQPTAQSAAVETEDGPDVIVENGTTYAIIPHGNGFRRVALDTSVACARPEFPHFVMKGTSIYENLVRPAVETSSKYAEFIFIPAIQLFMNYLSGKVAVELQPTNMNLFVGLISPYGRFFKSTSCQLAQDYMKAAGIFLETSAKTKDTDGKVVIQQAGSAEGFMLEMKRLNGTHAIMYNDELGKLVAKAGIENSSFSSDLLSWYGSAPISNNVKNERFNFSWGAGAYAFGWLWCTTDRNFNTYWPKLAGISSGIKDRMFFVVSPEKPRQLIPYRDPLFRGALKTKELIDRAIAQGKFRLDDPLWEHHIAGIDDPRSLDLLVKLSLYFAVDLGTMVVDDDCVERARALVDYRNQAAKFLEPIEAENQEGRLMKEILRELKQNGGRMSYRDLCLNLDYSRHGRLWNTAYDLLKSNSHGDVVEFMERRTAGKRKTRIVGLVLHDLDE